MESYFSPNFTQCMGKTDAESIQNAIRLAKETGVNKVVIPALNERTNTAEWIIDTAILLPDDIEIVLDNCYMRQADGVFDNMFRNENFYKDESLVSVEQRNIRITGIGNAVLTGGLHNGLTQEKRKDDEPPIHVNNTIFLHNVTGFAIRGIKVVEPRFWCIHLAFCSNGLLEDLEFECTAEFPNRDGIDLRMGCHDITIQNIRGVCEDDVVALTAINGVAQQHPAYDQKDLDHDIHHICIRNISAKSIKFATVALRCNDGMKVHDVLVDGVFDGSDGINQKPNTIIRFGQKAFARIRPSVLGEMSRITINNVHVQHGIGIMLNQTLADSKISNIFCGPETDSAISTSARSIWFKPGVIMRNVVFDGIWFDPENTCQAPVIELLQGKNFETKNAYYQKFPDVEHEYMENVVFRNVFPGRTENVIVSEYDGGYVVE